LHSRSRLLPLSPVPTHYLPQPRKRIYIFFFFFFLKRLLASTTTKVLAKYSNMRRGIIKGLAGVVRGFLG
jgi:hypothetical protein